MEMHSDLPKRTQPERETGLNWSWFPRAWDSLCLFSQGQECWLHSKASKARTVGIMFST